jgi:sec-independent protein translocase protein TatB
MEILGIGPLELLFIVLIALIVLGPKDMVKAGKTIGRTLRAVVTSDTWRVVNQASREVRNLPNRLMRESGIDELQKQMPSQRELSQQLGIDELNKSMEPATGADLSPWTTSPQTIAPPRKVDPTGEPQPDPGDTPAHAAASSEPNKSTPTASEDMETKDDPSPQASAQG